MTDTHLAALFFLQVAAILFVCRAVGWLGKRIGQPQVVGEMVAGFLMGPSLFGWLAPDLQAFLFPPSSLHVLFVVSQLGLVLYMFSVGLEFRTELMLSHARRAAAVAIAGIVAPFALGSALALMMFKAGAFFGGGVLPFHAVLFVGAAMSITAFPMLARIISERGIAGTALGTLALAAGAMNDAAAWVILAIVVGSFTGSTTLAIVAASGAAAYVAVVGLIGRPIFARLNARAEQEGHVAPWMLGVTLAMLAFGAWFTDTVGIYSVFGAFILGAGVPRGLLSRELQRLIEPVTTALLVPLFFVYTGLNSQLSLVNSPWLWTVTVLVFLSACVGKGLACWAAARLTGATSADALGIATLMNARGMMELILLNIGLQRGLITPTLFTILVLMAIGTTLMTGPVFGWIHRREYAASPNRGLTVGETPS
jgi:Kef-type K+ transport system membrane component KefB